MLAEQSLCEFRPQHIALISTDYPPLRTSAAVQMRDLAVEMHRLGHKPVVIVPTVDLRDAWLVEEVDGVTLLRIWAPKTRDVGYLRRAVLEFSLPFLIIYSIRKSPFARKPWDLVAWYSPTIFFGPLIWYLKRSSRCHAYLILRDIFPEWAVDLGIMRKGIAYAFFKAIANIQYAVADTIGVQTESNLNYMVRWRYQLGKNLEVLHNWQTPRPTIVSSIDISKTSLAGRKIAVYVGNMGIAQGMDILVDLAESLQNHVDVGFLFVGRGSELKRLKEIKENSKLTNMLFFDEIDSNEIPGLLSQCFLGLLALDSRHKTHNVPGKLLTYLLAGLPVLACVNKGTDVMKLINNEGVGFASDLSAPETFHSFLEHLLCHEEDYAAMSQRSRALANQLFSSTKAAKQIIDKCTRA